MIEVEAKIRVKDLSLIRKKILSITKYHKTIIKVDDYYTLENLKNYPHKSLRVRKMGKIYQINFKQSLSFENHIHAKKETEFTASNIEDFLALLKEFGFKKWLRKEKKSEVYRISENFHIELNNVKDLGWFVEVEYLAKPNEVKYAEKRVLDVLKSLGYKEKDFIKEGYTKLLWDKQRKV